jgi:hypothetical protein
MRQVQRFAEALAQAKKQLSVYKSINQTHKKTASNVYNSQLEHSLVSINGNP